MEACVSLDNVKGLTMQTWIEAETAAADFGDERLNRRYELLLDRLSDKPTLSIPAACRGWAETTAAYRFFDSDKTDAVKVLKPHQDATLARIEAHEVVIVAQDTTEIELTRKQMRVGGPLNEESRWGLYVPLTGHDASARALGRGDGQDLEP